MTQSQALNAFVQALQQPDFFARAVPGFALLPPGDWQALLEWAAAFGYSFTLQDLHALCSMNPAILAQTAASDRLAAWNIDSLAQAAKG